MKLYHHPASYNARRAIFVARHVGAPVEYVLVDLMKGAQQQPDFLALNPNGFVPVLVDGDFTLWESTAIGHYLVAKMGSDLAGTDAQSRADVIRWESWALAHLSRATDIFLFENLLKGLFGLGAPSAERLETATNQFHKFAKVLDAHLAGKKWICGDALTLADCSIAAIFSGAENTQVPWRGYGEIQRWFKQIEGLPAWQSSAG